ncbi:MAG: BamA/TamA family outer membrane protein, partial [Planctomycetota bacterium]
EVDDDGYVRDGRVWLRNRYDQRDHPLLSTRGWLIDLGVAWSLPQLASQLEYVELDCRTSVLMPLGTPRLVLALGAKGTTREILDGSETLPVQFRLFNGGSESVRSYHENDLGPVDADGDPLGGLTTATASAELRVRLDEDWSLVGFYDIGWVDAKALSLSTDPGQALGGGIRLDLPIGPLRLDVAHGFGERHAADSDVVVHFSLGHHH